MAISEVNLTSRQEEGLAAIGQRILDGLKEEYVEGQQSIYKRIFDMQKVLGTVIDPSRWSIGLQPVKRMDSTAGKGTMVCCELQLTTDIRKHSVEALVFLPVKDLDNPDLCDVSHTVRSILLSLNVQSKCQ